MRLRQLGKVSDLSPQQVMRISSRLEEVFSRGPSTLSAFRRKRKTVTWAVGGVAACMLLGMSAWYTMGQRNTGESMPAAHLKGETPVAETVVRPRPYERMQKIDMVDATTGWATSNLNSTLLRTTNGGKDWIDVTPVKTSPQGLTVVVLDADVVYAATIEGSGTSRQSVVYGTHDGGAHWEKSNALGNGEIPADMSFVDEKHGWMTTTIPNNDLEFPGSFYRTVDGGKTWTIVSKIQQNGHYLLWTAFNDPSNGIAVVVNVKPNANIVKDGAGGILDYSTTAICTTHDGGQNWVKESKILMPGDTEYPNIAEPQFVGGFGYLVIESTLYVSRDQGKIWTKQGSGASGGDIEFVDPMHGWGLGPSPNVLLFTKDGGKTWSDTTQKVPTVSIIGFDFINATTGWVLAIDGVYKTTNGGATWSQVNSERSWNS